MKSVGAIIFRTVFLSRAQTKSNKTGHGQHVVCLLQCQLCNAGKIKNLLEYMIDF